MFNLNHKYTKIVVETCNISLDHKKNFCPRCSKIMIINVGSKFYIECRDCFELAFDSYIMEDGTQGLIVHNIYVNNSIARIDIENDICKLVKYRTDIEIEFEFNHIKDAIKKIENFNSPE